MVLITRLPMISFNLALEPILGFLLESTNRHMIAIQQIVYLSTRSIPKNENTIHGLIKTQDGSRSKFKSKHKDPILEHSQYKSMTLRIHLLSNYDANTCNYTKTFQYVQHHSPISKISLARST